MVKPKIIKELGNKIDSLLTPLAKKGRKLGIKANHISLLQIPFVILFFLSLSNRIQSYAILGIGISLFLDLLDGSWARANDNVSEKGHIYDKVMDLVGIYAFLAGIGIGFPSLIPIVLILGAVSGTLYFSNRYLKPELYCGVRSIGLLGVILNNLYPFLLLSTLIGVTMIWIKIGKGLYDVKS